MLRDFVLILLPICLAAMGAAYYASERFCRWMDEGRGGKREP